MKKLNKPFEYGQTLSSSELNNVTDAVDGIIDVLSSLDEGESTLTDAQIEASIKDRTDEIKEQIDADVEELNGVIEQLSEGLEGTTSDLVKAKNAIGLIVQSDEHGDSIKRAAIVAAINEDGNSIAGISADKIVLDGNTTVSGKFTSLEAQIASLTAAKANITSLESLQAIVNNIQAGSITVNSLLAKGNSDYPRVVINSTDGIQLLTSASASAININMDGSGSLANGNITWDTNGNLTINGTFKVGAKYIEYIYDNSVEPSANISTSATGVTASVTVRNTNNFDVYCNVQWYADSTNAVWSTSNTTDILKIDANSSRTIEDGVPAQDIQNYDSSISIDTDHSGADLVNVYHYIDRNS